ncbi:16S rRNA (guanine966-N2)-methyltransferase [Actinobaculum suis]|uniref:16S rRNA (Guanine(966)-N(2))-methyltransferase RsmD n=1 Tax=Actinobaculum suis TaxID=1657 RepID=A0A1G7E1W9_9ACTO|nr:16S rRNA (guanine(966)-N(2))-methyltransferase RsmD [Actinobaculum suis]MDY5153277.1 16S rRNA (guanine(966)-N(2))-methyltransferase RsmD [Actinobaculum suis]SDE57510.1 16S rRNA (guanine966-N2)-methyltransferase [Actinobaculum suis]
MTRIVAGAAKGRNLKVPKSGTRPTSEKVREAIFSALEHRGFIRDCTIVDLFSGSGACGLEAKSRGAKQVVCVESSRPAAAVIRENARHAGLEITVAAMTAEAWVAEERPEKFDVAFIDPPYKYTDQKLTQLLANLEEHLQEDGLAVVERDARSPEPNWPAGWELVWERSYGDTRVWAAGQSQ